MRVKLFFFIILLSEVAALQEGYAQKPAFIKNKGQWKADFDYLLKSGTSHIYLSAGEVTYSLRQEISLNKNKSSNPHNPYPLFVKGHNYKLQLIGANKNAQAVPDQKHKAYFNYLLGNDRSRWQARVPLFSQVTYKNIYPGIDIRYHLSGSGVYTYDFIVHPGADPSAIKMHYTGADTVGLSGEKLLVQTSVQNVVESAPHAYQPAEGEQKEVRSNFRVEGNAVQFYTGEYNRQQKLIIDPTLVFSTYTGSYADNFGFTATYGVDSSAYGGGIVFQPDSAGYPVTMGAFRDTFMGSYTDIGISKFSKDGSQLLYSTYLGGSFGDYPASIIEGPNRSLIILGNTSSPDFPVTSPAYDTSFNGGPSTYHSSLSYPSYEAPNGLDIFVTILDSTGGNLVGSTYMGGTDTDGKNTEVFNYGDANRGDIDLDPQGNIYIASNGFSSDFPTTSGTAQPSHGGQQDGLVFSLNSDLSTLNWSTYFGGSSYDALFSVQLTGSDRMYVTGGSSSSDLNYGSAQSYSKDNSGKKDGLIAELDPANGQVLNFTFTGTPADDISFFTDVDYDGAVYCFGQTFGNFPIVGDSLFQMPGSAQFLQKFDSTLSTLQRSTVFGDGFNNRVNISPTALMVDNCKNLYLSGWGHNNGNFNMGGPQGLPTTPNAYRDSTDNKDFYFMSLDATWKRLTYATFFGEWQAPGQGLSYDHVDGGTSRFRKDGTIYQAACAGCRGSSGFPTTPGAYSHVNNSSNCNLAIIRFDFEAKSINVDVEIDKSKGTDSGCVPYTTPIINKSYNDDLLIIKYPSGRTDTNNVNSVTITDTGYQVLKAYAIDTTCNLIDSTELYFYGINDQIKTSFTSNYDSCSNELEVKFTNESTNQSQVLWVFGDGDSSQVNNPTHRFEPGTYTVKLYNQNNVCNRTDSAVKTYTFKQRLHSLNFNVNYDPCSPEKTASLKASGQGYHKFSWAVNGQKLSDSAATKTTFSTPGVKVIELKATDTACDKTTTREETINVFSQKIDTYFPNVFTPNGDGLNDQFGLSLDGPAGYFKEFRFTIYDRRGQKLFETHNPGQDWDGKVNNTVMPGGVYFYVLNYRDICNQTEELRGFFHLIP